MKLKLPLKRDGKLCIFRGNPVLYLCKEPKQSHFRIIFFTLFSKSKSVSLHNWKLFFFSLKLELYRHIAWCFHSKSIILQNRCKFDKNQKNSMHWTLLYSDVLHIVSVTFFYINIAYWETLTELGTKGKCNISQMVRNKTQMDIC